MKKLKISDFDILKQFDKIIVTGPPRSGTTISGLILANELNYKFVDETFYDGNNLKKFTWFLGYPNRKMVIQNTSFTRDLHILSRFYSFAIVLIRRNIKDILDSFENSKKFPKDKLSSPGMFTSIDEEAQKIIGKHYNMKEDQTLPEVIYSCIESNMCLMDQDKLFELNYEDLSNNKLFVKKEDRRKNFNHIKQVKVDDPHYLSTKMGVMVL